MKTFEIELDKIDLSKKVLRPSSLFEDITQFSQIANISDDVLKTIYKFQLKGANSDIQEIYLDDIYREYLNCEQSLGSDPIYTPYEKNELTNLFASFISPLPEMARAKNQTIKALSDAMENEEINHTQTASIIQLVEFTKELSSDLVETFKKIQKFDAEFDLSQYFVENYNEQEVQEKDKKDDLDVIAKNLKSMNKNSQNATLEDFISLHDKIENNLFVSSLFIHSIYFDISNFPLSSDNSNIGEVKLKINELNYQMYGAELFRLIGRYYAYNKIKKKMDQSNDHAQELVENFNNYQRLKEQKIEYLNSITESIREKVNEYISIFKLHSNLSFIPSINEVTQSFYAHLMKQEYIDFFDDKNLDGYSKVLRENEGISKLSSILLKFEEQLLDEDENADLKYLSMFLNKTCRTKKNIELLSSNSFYDIFYKSTIEGWSDNLVESIEDILPALNNHSINKTLSEQNSGSLLMLLKNKEYQNTIINHFNPNINFESLETILEMNSEVFKQIFPQVDESDSLFLENLIKIISFNHFDYSKIQIDEDSKKLISKLKDIKFEHIEALLTTLNNFEIVKKATLHGFYNDEFIDINDVEDQNHLCNFVSQNLKDIEQKVQLFEQIKGCMKGSRSTSLRDDLIQIANNQGPEFFKKYFYGFGNLNIFEYQRVCNLLTQVENPKEMCRKRENKNSLIEAVKNLKEQKWRSLVNELKEEQNCENYSQIIESYYTKDIKKISATSKSEFIDDVIDLRKIIDPQNYQSLLELIDEDQNQTIGYIISQIKNGMPNTEIKEFLELYKNDSDFNELPPQQIFRTYKKIDTQKKQAKSESIDEQVEDNFDELKKLFELNKQNFDFVKAIIEEGFQVKTRRFIGENYIPTNHIFKNIHGKYEDKSEVDNNFYKALDLLIKNKVLIHHIKKGKVLKSACVSINPHVGQIENESLREYMRQTLYERNNSGQY